LEEQKPTPQRRKRRVNRSAQGDLGEFSAMEWLASRGALVWIPLGHSPHVDLVAEFEGHLTRVQVKTCTYSVVTPNGHDRWSVSIVTRGGNRSWTGEAKQFDPARVDYLFVLVGDGRRWFIPAHLLEASQGIALGGSKYSEFEVERGRAIEALVYGEAEPNRIPGWPGECQSGQMEQTVNLPAMPTEVRILPPPLSTDPARDAGDQAGHERELGRSGHALLRPKRQATIPKLPCQEAGLEVGDRMRVRADGPGRVVLERIEAPGSLLGGEASGHPLVEESEG
jgi:hypothetical protein